MSENHSANKLAFSNQFSKKVKDIDMVFDHTFTGVSQLIIFHETNIAMSLGT